MKSEYDIIVELQRVKHYLERSKDLTDDRYRKLKGAEQTLEWLLSDEAIASVAHSCVEDDSQEEHCRSNNIAAHSALPNEDTQMWMAQKREPWYAKTEHSMSMRRKRWAL